MQLLTTSAILLALFAFLTTSCADNATPKPTAPEPTATVTRNIAYRDAARPARRDTVFQEATLTPSAELSGSTLFVNLRTKPNREGFLFALNRSRLSATLVGSYSYQSRQDVAAPTNLQYYRFMPGSDGTQSWSFGSLVNIPTGTIIITAYDTERQLLSGTFTAGISDASDPFEEDNAPTSRRCTIALSGTFTNVSVQLTK